jgi:hypothetical protein
LDAGGAFDERSGFVALFAFGLAQAIDLMRKLAFDRAILAGTWPYRR